MLAGTGEVLGYELRDSAAWLTLNRPAALNALSPSLVNAIVAALDRATGDEARSVVIAANGAAFCAGADLNVVSELQGDPGAVAEFVVSAAHMVERVARHPRPVVAAVQGAAIAGGLELALACDLVIAAEEATFSDGHARYGLFPGAGATARLPRRIGVARAKYLMFTGDAWSATAMLDCGLVNAIVPRDRLHETVADLTERLGARSAAALERMKRVVDEGSELPLAEACALERKEFEDHAAGADFAEGLAAWSERRAPRFTR